MKKNTILHLIVAICTALVALTPSAGPARATGVQSVDSAGGSAITPASFINPDGTLDLGNGFNGSLDISDWNVTLDPLHGPLFSPLAVEDEWDAVGSGGGPFKDVISTVVVNGTDVYVGGWFNDAGDNPAADWIARWDGSEWLSVGDNGSGGPALSSQVSGLVFIGSDLYVSGWFSVVDTSATVIPNAAKFAKWSGSAWSAVPGITADLNANAESLGYDPVNSVIYVGGNFTDVNGNGAADRLAGIDLDTNSLVVLGNDGSGGGSLNSAVYAIAADSAGSVYAGGFFQNVNNGGTTINEADYVAKWNGTNWSALSSNGAGDGSLSSVVTALAIDASDNVYVGGGFLNVSNAGTPLPTADYIAKWNGTNWSALGSNGAGNGALIATNGGSPVQKIIIDGTDIYVGGFFLGGANIPTADFVARFNTSGGAWNSLGNDGAGDGSLSGGVVGMAFDSGNLYAGGYLYDVNNGGTVLPLADYFAVWSGTNWSTLGAPNGILSSYILAIATVGTDVYVGGSFQNAGGDPRMDNLIRWDGSQWNPVGNVSYPEGSVNSAVQALAVDGTDLYVGGLFAGVENEGVAVNGSTHIAKWDAVGETWSALDSGLPASVFVLAVDASHNVYAAGSFANADSIPEADYIAKWNGSGWSALAGNGSGAGAVSGPINCLVINGSDMYVGGNFFTVLDTSNAVIPNAHRIAKWDMVGETWSAMPNITTPPTGNIYALNMYGSRLYMGGSFDNLNGLPAADNIAMWNGSGWFALGVGSGGNGSVGGQVNAIAVDNGDVYVGGYFVDIDNAGTALTDADYVAKWDGSGWSALGSNGSGDGSLNSFAASVAIVQHDVWVGGAFTNVNNTGTVLKEADHLAAYGLNPPPAVVSVTRVSPSPTSAASVDFTITFSESVTGVDSTDFAATTAGVSGASLGGVGGSGTTYTVTVNTGAGNGTIRLDVLDDDTILDTNSISPDAAFTSGEVYAIAKTAASYKSLAAYDGWVLESSETSKKGGSISPANVNLRVGDEIGDKQYRSILHFDTKSIPDGAVVILAQLRVKSAGLVGTNPFNTHLALLVDIRKPSFGTAPLANGDFQAATSLASAGTMGSTKVNGWYTASLVNGLTFVNKTGTTQFRLRFTKDDNDDNGADYLKLYSGNAGASSQPVLRVYYYIP